MEFSLSEPLLIYSAQSTSVDPNHGSLTQIAAVRVNQEFGIVGPTIAVLSRPIGSTWDPAAWVLHGRTREEALQYIDPPTALDLFMGSLHTNFRVKFRNEVFAAWDLVKTLSQFKRQFAQVGTTWQHTGKCLDLRSIVLWELAQRGEPLGPYESNEEIRLIMKRLGLPPEEGHQGDAVVETKNVIKILQALRR